MASPLDNAFPTGACPHVAMLLSHRGEVAPTLASFYALGAKRNGWLFHRAIAGRADEDRAALTEAGLDVERLEAEGRMVFSEIEFGITVEDWVHAWEPGWPRSRFGARLRRRLVGTVPDRPGGGDHRALGGVRRGLGRALPRPALRFFVPVHRGRRGAGLAGGDARGDARHRAELVAMKPARRLPWLEIAIWSGAAAAVSACLVILVDAGPGVSAGLVILVLLAAAGLRLYFAGDHNVGGGLFVTAVVSGVVVLVQMEADRRQAEQDAHRERLQNRSDERERRLVERQTLAVTLGQSRELPGIDLSGRDLSGFYLAGKRLNGARLAGARLDNANLAGIDLRRADLSDAKLKGADLVAADLSGADLTGADLRSANLAFADMRGANLANATLRGANLNAADLRSAVDQQFSSPAISSCRSSTARCRPSSARRT